MTALPASPLMTALHGNTCIRNVPSLYGAVPFGSTLCHQLLPPDVYHVPQPVTSPHRHAPLATPSTPAAPDGCSIQAPGRTAEPANVATSHQFIDLPLPHDCSSGLAAFSDNMLLSEAVAIERRTRQQTHSPLWHKLRSRTLTASRFHLILHRKTVSQDFLASLTKPRDLSHVPAIQHGQAMEGTALEDYVTIQRDSGNQELAVRRCGLVLCPTFRYIGASPDGVVFDPTADTPYGLLEIKCPLSAFDTDLTPVEACESPSFCCVQRDGRPKLKETHAYYYQVQDQMGVTGLKWCDFLLWRGPRRVSCERIHFNERFWLEEVLPNLARFYVQHLKSMITDDAAEQ